MAEVILEHGYILTKMVNSMKGLLNDVSLEFNTTGLTFQALDCTHVSLTVLKLNKDAFVLFTVENYMSLPVDMEKLAKILEFVRDDDSITITVPPLSTTIGFSFKNDSNNAVYIWKFIFFYREDL